MLRIGNDQVESPSRHVGSRAGEGSQVFGLGERRFRLYFHNDVLVGAVGDQSRPKVRQKSRKIGFLRVQAHLVALLCVFSRHLAQTPSFETLRGLVHRTSSVWSGASSILTWRNSDPRVNAAARIGDIPRTLKLPSRFVFRTCVSVICLSSTYTRPLRASWIGLSMLSLSIRIVTPS